MGLNQVMIMLKSVLMMMAPQLKKADSVEGVKEIKEALDGSLALGVVLAERLKDGVGIDDLSALWTRWGEDQELRDKLKAAVDGYEKISAEAKDLDLGEGLELASVMVDYVPKYVDALKKEDPANG